MIKINSSTTKRNAIIDAIGALVMRWQDATQEFDEAFGSAFDLNATERRCLGALAFGPKPAGTIAEATGLTPAAVTSLIDRLEARGFVTRGRDAEDRRKVVVSLTNPAGKVANGFYGPIAMEGRRLLSALSDSELETVNRFLSEATSLQERYAREARTKKPEVPEGLQPKRSSGVGGR